jgi:hypothetical protein
MAVVSVRQLAGAETLNLGFLVAAGGFQFGVGQVGKRSVS